jgi:hypothetical protein
VNTMSNNNFEQAYRAGFGAVLTQVARDDGFRTHLTKAALTLAAGVAIALTGAQEANAQQPDNGLVRFAKNTVGAVIGGALGSQIGGGSGKTAATVAGAAAGVWASEELLVNGSQQQRSQQNHQGSSMDGPALSMRSGPQMATPQSMQHMGRGSNIERVQQHSGLPQRLSSGTTPMTADRHAKLAASEQAFLGNRDALARALFSFQQSQDDTVLDPRSRSAKERLVATESVLRNAQGVYGQAKSEFLTAVEHMGARGYDVHQFAYSHGLAYNQVTAKDMARNDIDRAALLQQPRQVDAQLEGYRIGESGY